MMTSTSRFIFLAFVSLLFSLPSFGQSSYKEMMHDPSVNFYDACTAADLYFQTHDPTVKGSGWKGYQRWRAANEYKYYPSGDRSQVDPLFVAHAYQDFLDENPTFQNGRLFNNGWEELGPFTIDSITGHYAAGLGRVEDFYVDPANTNRLYLGSRSGGFWSSTNGGANWQGGATDFLMASGVNAIGVSPTNPDSILINVRNSRNGYSHGVYRSADGGASFAPSNFVPASIGFGGLGDNFAIYKIAYHPTIPNLVFVGTNEGLYRSDDNLTTWVRQMNGADINRIQFHPTNSNIVYVYDTRSGNRNEVLRSTNAGVSFSLSNTIPGNNNSSGRLSVSNDCASCLYFASGNGIWKSLDDGQNFTFIINHGGGNGGFTVHDQDTSNMLNGYVDLVATTDGGQTFTQTTSWYLGSALHGTGSLQDRFQNTDRYVHADLRVAKSINGVYYVGTDGYLCSSTDNGTTWTVLSRGTAVRENYSLGISQSDHYRSISGSQDNGTSLRVRDQWVEFYGADGMEAVIHPLNYNWFMASFQYGGRRLSKNGGLSSSSGHPSGQSGSGNADWIAPLAYDPNDHMSLYHFSKQVWKSDQFGGNWVQLGSPTTFTGNIQRAAIAENNSDIMAVSRSRDIELSVDGGLTFVDIQNNLPNSSIQDIEFDPNNDAVIAVVYGSYQNNNQKIYVTTDTGSTWTNITFNLGNMPLRSVVIDHSDDANIYVGAEIGVYVKPFAGNTWTLFNTDLPNTSILEMEINYGSNTLKAATWGRGMWEYSLKDRANYPAILTTEINDLPTDILPVEGSYQYVTSLITYDNTLSSVYTEWSANTPTFGNVIPMTNTMDSTWVTQTALPHFPVGTKLYFKVYAVGATNDTTETYKFMYTVRPFDLCNATGSTGTGSDYINTMTLNSITNNTIQDYYGDYTNIFIDLAVTQTYTLQVGLATAFSQDSCSAWIDYNRNGVFEPVEQIVMGAFDVNDQSFGTFTVPAISNIGDTVVMRIRNAYNSNPNPCGTVAGEVEDYSIVLKQNVCVNSSATIAPTTCTPYTAPDGVIYTTSGNYTATIPNAASCDSVITINLTVGANTAATVAPNVCTPYTAADGAVYTTSGNYAATIPNVGGCDSVITINLTVGANTAATVAPITCTPYTAPDGAVYTTSGNYSATIPNTAGCDSVVTINLTIGTNTAATIAPTTCTPYTAPDGTVYTTSGNYSATIPNAAGCDSVIAINLTIGTNTASTIAPNSCTPYTAPDGSVYTTSGTYSATIPNANGCDSVIAINLTVGANTASTIAPSTCTPYTAPDGMVYTTSGSYAATIPNAGGCDSVIAINLTVGANTASTLSPNVCDPYTAPDGAVYTVSGNYTATIPNASGCDSVIAINLTVGANTASTINPVSCGGAPYTAPDGAVYTVAGNYTAIIPNAAGCDSLMSINLSVVANLNTATSLSGNTLTATATGVSYQWLNCSNGYMAIPTATGQSFTPLSNGTYAVQISDGGCLDTSACTNVVVVGLEGFDALEVKLYPNPTQSAFQITFGQEVENIRVRITDVSGKILLEKQAHQTDLLHLNLEAASGMYFVEVEADGYTKVFKLRKDQ